MKNLSFIPVLLLVLFSKLISFNWIIGSVRSAFSCSTIFAPVIAKQFGFGWISLFFISQKLLTSSTLFLTLLHRTPLLFAAQAYQRRHWLTSLVVPALCMMLFVMHETGSVAWCYSLYWLIPMVLYFFPDTVVVRALTASFVAHGVGSVVWLYTGCIDASVWIALIPVVACERLLMAGGMIAVDIVIGYVKKSATWPWLFVARKLGFA